MSVRTLYQKGFSAANPTFASLLVYEKNTMFDQSRPLIIALHGHGGGAVQYQPGGVIPAVAEALANAGYIFLSIDTGSASWASDAAMTAITDAVNWVASKVKVGKIGVMGYSMNGLGALNWIKRNPTKVAAAWLWNPLLDLDWARSTVGYSPPEGGASANVAGWTTEIDAAYGNDYATNGPGHKVMDEPASYRLGIPIKVSSSSDDATVPIAQARYWLAQVNDPLVTQRLPEPTGGHVNGIHAVPTDEVISFFKSYL